MPAAEAALGRSGAQPPDRERPVGKKSGGARAAADSRYEPDARSGIAERTLEHGFCPPRGTHGRRVVGIHPSGEADVACVRREPRRHVSRGMSERALVWPPLQRATHDRGAVHRLRLPVRAATQQALRLHPRPYEFAFALAHYTFRIPIHRTDIILGIGLGDTTRSGPISQSLNCKSSSSDRPKCHDKTYDK